MTSRTQSARIVYMSTVPLAEVRANLSRMVDEAVRTHERVEITRNGRREAVLLGSADYDVLIETLDVLSDDDLVRELRASLDEASRGDTLSTAELLESMRDTGRGDRTTA